MLDHADGLVCLSRLRDPRRARPARACAGCARPSARPPAGRAAAPVTRATTAPATARWRRSRSGSACPPWRPATSTPTTAPRPAARRLRGHTRAHDARRLRAAAPRQPRPRARHPAGDGRALRRPPRRGGRDRTSRRAARLRSLRGPRLPLPRAEDPDGAAPPGRAVRRSTGEPLPRRPLPPRRRAAAHRRGARPHQPPRPRRLLPLHHDLLELAREVAVEVRGPDTARALLPPGRGRGSSVSSIVCYLTGLSHVDPIENELLLGRFLNDEITALPDIDLDFPRDVREVLFPRVHERYGARALGPRRRLPDLPLARRHPRARQGAGAAARGNRESRARLGGAGRRRTSTGDIAAAYGPAENRPGRRWALALAAGRAGHGPAAPPLPAPGRDGRGDAAADRLLPGRARGDGRPPDGPVGQGLLRATPAS